jgi:hypothetical protein
MDQFELFLLFINHEIAFVNRDTKKMTLRAAELSKKPICPFFSKKSVFWSKKPKNCPKSPFFDPKSPILDPKSPIFWSEKSKNMTEMTQNIVPIVYYYHIDQYSTCLL